VPVPDCAVTNQGLPGTLFPSVMTVPGSHGLRQIIPGNPAAVTSPKWWLWLTCLRPVLRPLGPTQASAGSSTFFRILSVSWRAPLRNRTVDLLLTMDIR
jgi:hypothetical protein